MNQVLVSSGVIFGVHGLGNLSYHIAKGLYEHNMLEKVFAWDYKKTDLPDNKIKRIVPMGYYLEKVLGGFRNRIYKDFPQYLLQCEFFDIMCSYYTNSTKANIVYGGGGTTLRTMKRLKKKGIKFVFPGFSTHPNDHLGLQLEEAKKYGVTLSANLSSEFLFKKIKEEIKNSDYIIAASELVKDSMVHNGVPKQNISVIPFGVDTKKFNPGNKKGGKFRVLFAGSICLRKGVPYLLEAWDSLNLKNAELILSGGIHSEMREILKKYKNNNTIQIIEKTNIERLYKTADIFVFPSIEEGSALVTYESMASGLPIVTTMNSGSVAKDKKDGFIIPARNIEKIKEKILYFYDNPKEVKKMGKNARNHMVKEYTWDHFEERTAEFFSRI